MKNQKSVFEFGNEYRVEDFYDVDINFGGVEVFIGTKNLGSIVGLSIPDTEDEDENVKFDDEVINWLVDNSLTEDEDEDPKDSEVLTLSTESFDEGHTYLIETYGIDSLVVQAFYKFGRSDNAVNYAIELGFDIED